MEKMMETLRQFASPSPVKTPPPIITETSPPEESIVKPEILEACALGPFDDEKDMTKLSTPIKQQQEDLDMNNNKKKDEIPREFFGDLAAFGLSNADEFWLGFTESNLATHSAILGQTDWRRLHCGFKVARSESLFNRQFRHTLTFSLYFDPNQIGIIAFVPVLGDELRRETTLDRVRALRMPLVNPCDVWQDYPDAFAFGVDFLYKKVGRVSPEDATIIKQDLFRCVVYQLHKVVLLPAVNTLRIAQECQMCGRRAPPGMVFKACSKCEWAFYCSRTCQIQSWKHIHKSLCKLLVKARAESPTTRVCVQKLVPCEDISGDERVWELGLTMNSIHSDPELSSLLSKLAVDDDGEPMGEVSGGALDALD